MKKRTMYIEQEDNIAGSARVGRVIFSKTGKTLYYGNQSFQSLKGAGYKAHYFDVETGRDCWTSGPRQDSYDALYFCRVKIDDNVQHKYWRTTAPNV